MGSPGSKSESVSHHHILPSPIFVTMFCVLFLFAFILMFQEVTLSAKVAELTLLNRNLAIKHELELQELAGDLHKLSSERHELQEKLDLAESSADVNLWQDRLALQDFNFSKSYHQIRAGNPSSWQQRTFIPHGHYGFVQFSGHRLTPYRIGVTGMVYTRTMKFQEFKGCVWHMPNGTTIPGSFRHYIDDSSAYNYTGQVMWCDLARRTGDEGGYLVGTLNNEDIVMYKENPKQPQGDLPPEFELVYCSAPLYGPQDSKNVKAWFDYHRSYVGIQRFVLYNVTSVDDELQAVLRSFLNDGSLEIVDMGDVAAFNFYLYGQVMALNDCVHSFATRARWLFLHDLDEFVWAVPPNTVFGLLKQNSDKVWLTHGAQEWDVSKCLRKNMSDSGRQLTSLERMTFRSPKFHCDEKVPPKDGEELCIYWTGHRKLILQPRNVTFTHVHEVRVFQGQGVNLNARTDFLHQHYRGLNAKNCAWKCRRQFDEIAADGSTVDGGKWRSDRSMVDTMLSIIEK